MDKYHVRCSFCFRRADEWEALDLGWHLYIGPVAHICSECIKDLLSRSMQRVGKAEGTLVYIDAIPPLVKPTIDLSGCGGGCKHE